tara:strand:- start:666 stop:1052 length:387 start_codon:yes stop_codon:yes gene_type:complete
MSTIKAANLQNTGSGAPVFKNSSGTEIGQLAKAWVNFNGTGTVAIRTSFNVSSITDLATGRYQVNFTNAVAADCCPVMFNSGDGSGSFEAFGNAFTGGITTGTAAIKVSSHGSGFVDSNLFFVVVFGA